jgi:uncharacterized protein (DUF427 family)
MATTKPIRFEPTLRRIRVELAGNTVADTDQAMLMCEPGHLPVYYLPLADIRMDLFRRTNHSTTCPHKGVAAYWSAVIGGRVVENAMWSYPEPYEHAPPGIENYGALYWDKMDRWLEEDEEVFVHPRDPQKRVDAIQSSRRVEVVLDGTVVADSKHAVFLFETGLPTRYYIPRQDVRADILKQSEFHTRCPYKGIASYHDVTVNGRTWPNLVWYYPTPIAECPKITGLLSFFNEKVDVIRVEGKPQPKPVTKWS